MGYLIGTDEAGYGPNLGPLIISATLWRVPDGVCSADLYRLLAGVVTAASGRSAENGTACVVMADSKTLYQPGKGLRHLECGLWAAMGLLGRRPTTWREVWEALAPGSTNARNAVPWYCDYDSPVPLDADPTEIEHLTALLREGLQRASVGLVDLRSRAVFPDDFNCLVQQHNSKATALSHRTLQLAAELMAPLRGEPISVLCDKHGGRNHYHRLLSQYFPDCLIEIYGEGRSESVYRFGPPQCRIEFRFQSKAESHLPAALASMAAKYLRELAMRAWNDFWCRRVSGLRPTAGYPQDAKRFKADIAAVQKELGIDDALLWRVK